MVLIGHLPPVQTWPTWVQTLVIGPNAILLGVLTWLWWPKTKREWRRFGYVYAYLLAFFGILYFVFGWK